MEPNDRQLEASPAKRLRKDLPQDLTISFNEAVHVIADNYPEFLWSLYAVNKHCLTVFKKYWPEVPLDWVPSGVYGSNQAELNAAMQLAYNLLRRDSQRSGLLFPNEASVDRATAVLVLFFTKPAHCNIAADLCRGCLQNEEGYDCRECDIPVCRDCHEMPNYRRLHGHCDAVFRAADGRLQRKKCHGCGLQDQPWRGLHKCPSCEDIFHPGCMPSVFACRRCSGVQ